MRADGLAIAFGAGKAQLMVEFGEALLIQGVAVQGGTMHGRNSVNDCRISTNQDNEADLGSAST
ncbi:MAG: hypothetical protein D6698_14915 [Gammaproteobacteria bacterium]|nr:MAG: hypothetical protein D6698_14915 [Gammaproteobacteria bacterium]